MLEFSEYVNTGFEGEDFSEKELISLYFDNCQFESCDFSYASLIGCTFTNCTFLKCNFSLSKVPQSYFDKVQFDNCDMIGMDWTVGRWLLGSRKQKYTFPVSFNNCRLNYSVFVGMNLSEARFVDCIVKEAFFEDAIMAGCLLKNCDLEKSIFKNTDLRKADLSTAKNYDIDVTVNKTNRAKFSLPEALSLIYSLDIDISEEDN